MASSAAPSSTPSSTPSTSSSPSVGVVFRPQQPPERLREHALAAEEAGVEELWLWEDCFFEGGLTTSAMALAWTSQLRVGIGLLPVPLRNPALTAMEVAVLARAFPGRFLPGFGHGVQEWMGQAGVRPKSPITLMREYVPALRRLLAGEEVTVSGQYVNLDHVRLVYPSAVPLHLGAIGPKSLQVTGEVGDGTILVSGIKLEDLPGIQQLIEAGRAATGRTEPHELTVFLSARIGDPEATAETVRAWAAAGADRVVLEPVEDEPDPAGFLTFAGQQVAPLIG